MELTPLEIREVEKQVVDKFDDNALNYINEKYFRSAPLMIINTRTEQVTEQIQKSIWDKK